jgi:glycosyltransferase involved in cell wall biosynthesis
MPVKLVFLSLSRIDSLNERGIYHDLLREFVNNGYDITIVCPLERSTNISTRVIRGSNITILQVKTLNIQKCNVFEKGLATLSLNYLFKRAIRKYIKDYRFDLILYSTPPITLVNLISWLKSKYGAKTYLLLKDIFPQNAVDMGYFRKNSLLHKYFSMVEKQLYQISDKIGCMSPANVNYLLKLYPKFKNKLEINPNCVDLTQIPVIIETKEQIRSRWNIPQEATVFLYGGNLGKPQGSMFLLEVIKKCLNDVPNAYFLIVGDGTDFRKLSNWFVFNKPGNAQLIKMIARNEFDSLANSCDVGLILLRNDFTIPNFPSRLITYLENKLPVLTLTDTTTDIGIVANNNDFGRGILYGDLSGVVKEVRFFTNQNNLRLKMGMNGFEFLHKNYSSTNSFEKINQFINRQRFYN